MGYVYGIVRRVFLLLLLLVAVASSAWAGKTYCHLERIDPTQYDDGILRAYVSVVELEGTVVDDKGPKQFTLRANNKSLGAPIKADKFENISEPLDVAIVIETSALYGPPKAVTAVLVNKDGKKQTTAKAKKAEKKQKKGAKAAPTEEQVAPKVKDPIDAVKDAVASFLDNFDPRWRVLLIHYHDEVVPHPPLRPAGAITDELDELGYEMEARDLRLVEAVGAAILQLNKPRADGKQARKAIILVSDGLNYQMDRKLFRGLGDRAAQARIPIHTIGFSPTDERGPLLNLGEISKRSNGTFRWARKQSDLDAQFETLIEELRKQYVLTFKTGSIGDLQRKLFTLNCEDVVSNNFVFDATKLPKGMKWYWWVLIGLGALLLIVLVIAVIANNRTPHMVGPMGQHAGGQMPMPGQQQVAAGVPTRGLLIGITGTFVGQKLQVGHQVHTLGKGPSTFQITDDPSVSTNHAEIQFFPQYGFVITDKGSTNGTYVNDARIAQPTVLRDGDMIKLGSHTLFKFRAE